MSKKRTSVTDPMSFSTIPIGHGLIGLTICPGKKGASIYGGDWDRDLDSDIEAIAHWGASALVTVMTTDELSYLQVGDLGRCVVDHNMAWYQIPIPDLQAPNCKTLEQWDYIKGKIHTRLNQTEKILIHCRGGLGRSGTLAANLLMDTGFTPEAAIDLVRAARPGAIETSEQVAFLMR